MINETSPEMMKYFIYHTSLKGKEVDLIWLQTGQFLVKHNSQRLRKEISNGERFALLIYEFRFIRTIISTILQQSLETLTRLTLTVRLSIWTDVLYRTLPLVGWAFTIEPFMGTIGLVDF